MPFRRRQFLKSVAGAGALALFPSLLPGQSDDALPADLNGVRLEPFVDPLILPAVLRPIDTIAGSPHYQVILSEFQQKLHRDLPPSTVWGFEGATPGPTIEAQRDQSITVDWLNRLPSRHRLSIDHTLDGAGKNVPEVRTTIHLHGGHVAAANDGYPHDWITPGQQQRTIYPNRQPAATLWYHDHAMGITRLNAMMGLAGLYLIRGPEEQTLGLPAGRFDIPLVLQDRILDPRGQLIYPVGDSPETPSVPEFFGTQVLVNGRVTPYLEVEPRLYRFRLLNAANARVFQLFLAAEQPFIQIASDGGLLPAPVERDELLLAPGERIDVVLDFRGREGRRITLLNSGAAPYPSGGGGPVPRLVMQFQVRPPLSVDVEVSRIPPTLARVERLPETSAVKTRRLRLVEIMSSPGQPHRALLDGRRFMDPVSEDPKNGTIEIWEFVNTTMDAHPIHLHAIHFQLLDRRPFDVRRQQRTGEVVLANRSIKPAPEELGWKDTILCPPGQVTRIITPFTGEPGRFVWHCHMLEHEDNEMMRPFDLLP